MYGIELLNSSSRKSKTNVKKIAWLIILKKFCFPGALILVLSIAMCFNKRMNYTSFCFSLSFMVWCWLGTLLIASLEMDYKSVRIKEKCFGILRRKLCQVFFFILVIIIGCWGLVGSTVDWR